MKKLTAVIIVFSAFYLNAFSQGQANVWYMGNGAGLDFARSRAGLDAEPAGEATAGWRPRPRRARVAAPRARAAARRGVRADDAG